MTRTVVPQRLSLMPDERDALWKLKKEMGLPSLNRTVACAIRSLRANWEGAQEKADELRGVEDGRVYEELFLRIVREVGPADVLSKDLGRSMVDGRPYIHTNDPPHDETAAFTVDDHGQLVAQLKRGAVVDYFVVSDGRWSRIDASPHLDPESVEQQTTWRRPS